MTEAQNVIFQYLLSIVKIWPAQDVLDEFKHLFIEHSEAEADNDSELLAAIYAIAAANQEKAFKNTLKRSCYILINNWDIDRNHQAVKQLVQLFSSAIIRQPSTRAFHNRLRQWVHNFTRSQDFKELALFAARYDEFERLHWSQRYAAYLLMSQYVDKTNSREQRQAAKSFSRQLKDRFKLDLALYTAFSEAETALQAQQRVKDPTVLGEDSLQQIKRILAYSGPFNYEHLARLFRGRTAGLKYRRFKRHLYDYLSDPAVHNGTSLLGERLKAKLATLYPAYEKRPVDEALLLRTCNRLISSLITEDHQNPSDIFLWTIAQESPMVIVITLLQLLLISPKSRTHLEARIADLVRYYESYPEAECRWIIHFFEMFNVTMTVHVEDIRYSLIQVDALEEPSSPQDCRIFSQLKHGALPPEAQELPTNPFVYEAEVSAS
ncbi:MAG: hypothetical protein AAF289_00220 [Cyanobacteria bacterium P01_A01_bin.135]